MPSFVDYEEVLKYASPEYNFIVFHGDEEEGQYGELAFWTLEKTEEDAKRRVEGEIEAYGDVEDWQFFYRPFVRDAEKYAHCHKPHIDIQVVW